MTNLNNAAMKTFGAAMKPVLEFNNFFVVSGEATFTKQVECCKAYSKLGMDNVNDGLKIRTFEDIISYTEKQKDIAQIATDMFASDAKAFTELNNKFIEESRSLIETSIKTSVTAVNEVVKATT